MALRLIKDILCVNDSAVSYDAGDFLQIYCDDVTLEFYVELNNVEATSGGYILNTEVTAGYFQILDKAVKFCVGTTLNYFEKRQTFPYTLRKENLNSPSCTLEEPEPAVCDIKLTYGIAIPATEGVKDGQIGFSLSTSNGPVKANIGDFDPNTGGVDVAAFGSLYGHTFTGLAPGEYTIVIYDSIGCRLEEVFTVEIEYATTYATLYNFTFNDMEGNGATLLIEQRGYTGSVTEIQHMGPIPVTQTLEASDQDLENPLLPTTLNIELVNIVDKLYINLFRNTDERKFRIRFYMNYGSGNTLTFQGYLTQELLSEPYESIPYLSSIIATDRLSDLSNYDFGLKSGDVSILLIFVHCLKNTGVSNGFRIADNLYEQSQDQTAADDPWTQTFLDVKSFYENGIPDNCLTVLEKILRPRRAQILSWGGYWYIMRISERGSSWDYREFDSEGTYVTNSTINPIIDIKGSTESSRACFISGSNNLRLQPIYRKIVVQTNRKIRESLLTEFTEENINGGGFLGWTENLGREVGSWDYEKVGAVIPRTSLPGSSGRTPSAERQRQILRGPRNPGTRNPFNNILTSPREFLTNALAGDFQEKYVYVANFEEGQAGTLDNSTSGAVNEFQGAKISQIGTIEYSKNDRIEISFDYFYQINTEKMPYVNMKWMLRVGTKYLRADGTWQDAFLINDYFVTDFNKGSTFSIIENFDESFTENTTSSFEFRVYNIDSIYADVVGTGDTNLAAAIRTVPATGLDPGTRLVGKAITVGDSNIFYLYYYELIISSAGSSGALLIEPDDDSTKRWSQAFIFGPVEQDSLTLQSSQSSVNSTIRYGTIVIRTYPNSEDLPDIHQKTYTTGAFFNQVDLDYPLDLFDADTTINNFEKQVINYFKLSGGSPCEHWGPATYSNDNTIQKQLGKELAQQYSLSKQRITGAFRVDVPVTFYNVFRQVSDQNRVYLPVGMSIDYRSNEVEGLDMIEIEADDDVEIAEHTLDEHDNSYS